MLFCRACQSRRLYHFQVTATDAGLNSTQDPDDTFTTESYPVISNLSVDVVTKHSFTVSFDTDNATVADFWIRPTGGPVEPFSTLGNDGIYKTSHSELLNFFRKGTTPQRYSPAAGLDYEFAVIVTDVNGNVSVDSSGTFTTVAHPNDPVIDSWLFTDVGTQSLPGYLRFDESDSTFYVFSSGTSLFNNTDRHSFVYKPISGNFDFTAHLTGYNGMLFSHSKGAALFRASLNHDSEIYAQSFNWKGVDVLYYREQVGWPHTEVTPLEPAADRRCTRSGCA